MFVEQFYVDGIAHLSYLLGGKNTCAIVDPRRDVEEYLAAARRMGMKVTHVLETHLHADFVSGHLDLAKRTGARIVAPRSGGCMYDHMAVAEGDSFDIEDLHIQVLDTPGHTPDCLCYVVTDRSRGTEPVAIFTGDTLFVGDVGRPDLFPGRGPELASKLYDNLHGKVMKLPDLCLVYPAHGAGSLCGRAMGARMAGAAPSLSVRAWHETSYAYLGRRIQRCGVSAPQDAREPGPSASRRNAPRISPRYVSPVLRGRNAALPRRNMSISLYSPIEYASSDAQ